MVIYLCRVYGINGSSVRPVRCVIGDSKFFVRQSGYLLDGNRPISYVCTPNDLHSDSQLEISMECRIVIEAKIIAASPKSLTEAQAKRFSPRNKYLAEEFIPQLKSLGINSSLFDAITPNDSDLKITNDVVVHRGNLYKHGTNRQGDLSSNIQVVLTLGHLQLWKECVALGLPILIFEDDVYLESEDSNIVLSAVKEFLETAAKEDSKSILYLQSTCPWRPNKELKHYDQQALTKQNSLFRLASWSDTSGTAAYLVTPTSAECLVQYVSKTPLWAIDGMIHDANKTGSINIYIPVEYKRNFKLHPTLS